MSSPCHRGQSDELRGAAVAAAVAGGAADAGGFGARLIALGMLCVLSATLGCGGEGDRGGEEPGEASPESRDLPRVDSVVPAEGAPSEAGNGSAAAPSAIVLPAPSGEEASQVSVPAPFDMFDDPIVGPEGPPCDAVTQVFAVSCGAGGDCHVGIGIGDFALGIEQARALVGKAPNVNSVSCGLMINPDSPFESMILTKVTGDYPYEPTDCRTLMPPPFGGVTDAQIACLESWLWQFRR